MINEIKVLPIEEIDDESLIREVDEDSDYYQSLKEFMRKHNPDGSDPTAYPGMVEVRPNGSVYTLIEGAHRVMAAFQLGWTRLQVLVRNDVPDEITAQEVALASFNRVPVKPTQLGKALERVKEARGYTIQDLRKETGMTQGQIESRLKIKKLSGRVAELIDQGAIPITTAQYIAKLRKHGVDLNDDAHVDLLNRCATEPATEVVDDLKALIKQARTGVAPEGSAKTYKLRKKKEIVEFYEAISSNPDFTDEFKRGVLWTLGVA